MSDDSVQATVVGTNGGITERSNGWFEVAVAVPGKQYPVKLSTKKTEIIDAVRALGQGVVGTFSYTEMESDRINERTNKPFINRYLDGVVAGGTPATTPTASGSGGSTQMTNEDWNAKERRDFRSRSWAHTISAMHHTIAVDEDPALVFARLKQLQVAIYRDIVRELDGEQPAGGDQQTTIPTADTERPPDYDDDIPF